MAKSAQQIAADLEDLADELIAEADEYRRTAAALRKRAGGTVETSPRPTTARPSLDLAPLRNAGESQALLLSAYRIQPGRGLTVDELVEIINRDEVRLSKSAAQGANNRLLKKGEIERVGHGRYREVGRDNGSAVPEPLSGFSAERGEVTGHAAPS
jgi:hypothetical protein